MRASNRFVATAPAWDYRKPARPVTRLFRPANDNRPYKPIRHPFPGRPFGKRLPKPGEVGPARLPRLPQWSRYLKHGTRLVPAVSLGLTAYEVWQWYNDVPYMRPALSPEDSGFGLCCRPGPPDGPMLAFGSASSVFCAAGDLLCGSSLQVPASSPVIPEVAPGLSQWMARGRPQLGGRRMTFDEVWERHAPANQSLPEVDPAVWGQPQPALVPYPQPLVVPQRVPLPFPFRPPGVQPVPRPWPRKYPRPPALPEDRVSDEPVNRNPYERPSPRPRPVRKREKEPPKKRVTPTTARRLRTALGKIVGGASEAAELIDAMYEALPDEIRTSKDDTLVKKLDRIFQNADKIDVAKFIENAVKNQKEDAVWGDGWQKIADTFDIGSPTGIKLGFPR